MANDPRLVAFVESALRNGATQDQITETLRSSGWDHREVDRALSAYAGVQFATPIPKKRSSLLARDFVFYLSHFVMLYAATFGLLSLIFAMLNVAYPLPEEVSGGYRSGTDYQTDRTRYWTAWSIVFMPAYLIMAWKAEQRKKIDPACQLSTSRQWLTYLTLLVAGVTVLCDFVVLLDGVLSGESLIRFYLKTLAVFLVAGSVLIFYARDVRDTESQINKS